MLHVVYLLPDQLIHFEVYLVARPRVAFFVRFLKVHCATRGGWQQDKTEEGYLIVRSDDGSEGDEHLKIWV